MPEALLRQRLPSKPRLPVSVDWGHWMARDSVFALLGLEQGGEPKSLTGVAPSIRNGSLTWNLDGSFLVSSSASYTIVYPIGTTFSVVDEWTIIGRGTINYLNSSGYNRFATLSNGTSSTQFVGIGKNVGNNRYKVLSSADTPGNSATNVITSGVYYNYALTHHGNGLLKAWLDGTFDYSVVHLTPTDLNSLSDLELSSGIETPSYTAPGTHQFVYVFPWALTSEQQKELFADPYAPIRYRKLFVPTVGPAAGSVFVYRSFSIESSSTLSADKTSPTAFSTTPVSDSTISTSWSATSNSHGSLPVSIASIIDNNNNNNVLPMEWIQPVQVPAYAVLPIDWIYGFDKAMSLETAFGGSVDKQFISSIAHKSTSQLSALVSVDWVATTNKSNSLPRGQLQVIASQLNTSHPIAWKSSPDAVNVSPLAWRQVLAGAANINLTIAWFQLVRADSSWPLAWNPVVDNSLGAVLPIYWRGNLLTDTAIPYTTDVTVSAAGSISTSWIWQVYGDPMVNPMDWSMELLGDYSIPTGWIGGNAVVFVPGNDRVFIVRPREVF